eukprot:scaffold148_cov144-Isochrysis_galbana.AAC.8
MKPTPIALDRALALALLAILRAQREEAAAHKGNGRSTAVHTHWDEETGLGAFRLDSPGVPCEVEGHALH